MGIREMTDYIIHQAEGKGIGRVELADRVGISRPALHKLLNGTVRSPELTTVANLAYAIGVHPYQLISLFLSKSSVPVNSGWYGRKKKDDSRFIRDVTYPDGDVVLVNSKFYKEWEFVNAGDVEWIGRKLVCQDQPSTLFRKQGDQFVPLEYCLIPEKTELPIPRTMPGENITIGVEFTAPPTPAFVVSYWKMLDDENRFCFPDMEGLRCCVNVMEI